MRNNRRALLLLLAIIPLVPTFVVCLVMLYRHSPNPANDFLNVALFAVTVVVVNVTAIRISCAGTIRDSRSENNV